MTTLALFGGRPMIPPQQRDDQWPVVSDEDIDAIVRVLRRGGFTSVSRGEEHVGALEREYAGFVGTRHGVALANGTAALHVALTCSGVGRGDEVIVPALSFVASAMAVLHAGAVPVFVDVDPRSFNLDPGLVESKISPRTRAIMPVHLHGLPADMAEIMAIAARHHLIVVEDAAQAHGARYRGRVAGALGDLGTTSFNVSKNLPTCGEGGLLTTDNDEYAKRARMLRQFGESIGPNGEREYVSYMVGWNYKLAVIQAAFVRNHLRQIDAEAVARQENCRALADALAKLPGVVAPEVPTDRTHAFHFLRVRLDPATAGVDVSPSSFRSALIRVLQAEGVAAGRYQMLPLPSHPVFRDGALLDQFGVPPEAQARYATDDYPVTRAVLDDSLVLQRGLIRPDAAPLVGKYVAAFTKVWDHLDEVAGYARALERAPRRAPEVKRS